MRKWQATGADKVFNALILLAGLFFLMITLFPIIYVISASFSSGLALTQGRVWLFPVDCTLDGYQAIFSVPSIMRGFANSVFYTFVGTLINIILTLLAAYPLSRRDMGGRSWLMFLFLFTMLFSGGMIPSFLLVKNLGMLNTLWAIIIPGALNVWNMTITMNYFRQNIPEDMLEATRIDGCGDFRFFCGFAIPLSKVIIAVIGLFYAVEHWNSYFGAMLYLSDPAKYPLQLVLRDILVQNSMQDIASSIDIAQLIKKKNAADLLKYSVIVVSSLPMMLIYPFMQKYLVKGVLLGSLKG
ncbi:MAG TPA: sugar ABC transporter permease [Clostridiales bacterium]|nr:sugar ABC transporter permease [Clostridiales bacterium]